MADGIVDQLVIKVGIEVDDSEITDLKKELQNNKNNSIKIKPSIDSSQPTNFLDNKSAVVNNDLKSGKVFSDILENEKKSKEYLKELVDDSNLTTQKNLNKENNSGGSGSDVGIISLGGLAAIIASLVSAGYLLAKEVQQKYIDKLDRELDFANLAYETGTTADQMARLNYMAKNVGLSLDQIVSNARNFVDDLFTGQNEQKSMLLAALGINPLEKIRNIKTPEEAASFQADIYKQINSALVQGGFPAFIASQRAANIAGIPASQAFGYQNLLTGKNFQQAQEIEGFRGSVGSKESIINNFQDITTALQKSTAAVDRLLSTEDIAKKISIQTAEIQATTVKLINATLNIATPNNSLNNTLSRPLGFGNENSIGNFYPSTPSSSAQTKAGGN